MASILLSTAGAAIGSSIPVLGPLGRALGGAVGRAAGSFIDNALFGGDTKLPSREGPRLADLAVQTSTYGRMIPITYGTVRIAGNVIWSQPIKETATTTTNSAGGGGKGGGGGKVTQTTTTYSYSVSMAVAICEGPVDEVLRVWADAKQLDLSQGTYRIYKGGEEQLPDAFIEGFEGVGSTPAYRGQAYVVIEDFPLADFGNRIPNFTFEVKRKLLTPDFEGETVEEMIKSIIMIPGAGEFVYDTQVDYKVPGTFVGGEWVQQGNQEAINMHNPTGQANALLALDQLKETLPNTEWVAVVISWFADDLDAGLCTIKPGVEYQNDASTAPEVWTVAGFTRDTAHQVTLEGGFPRYGGTPDDESLLRYLDELKLRGYNIFFLPFFFMDTEDKPWRGRLTGSASDVADFFTKTDGYNAFITHYATLVADKVDAFAIGSELIGLTKVTDTPGNYPAVNELVSLAATVKGIVGPGVLVTYNADWSEYHHTDGGWYNLDPLWASANIDMIGIDAYFPLTDAPQNGYDIQPVIEGWTSGEHYDFYYTDPGRTTTAPLAPEYAIKNIAWFWNNTHVNPDLAATGWVPNSKPIWFTEYGFPSVDGAANQPNVFYDPTSSESFFPYHSKGRVDFRAQRQGIAATLAQWKDSSMVEQLFLWTWDARPFPYWPDLNQVWNDGNVWKTGHWVEGKLGLSGLAAIIKDICARVGLGEEDIDVSRLTDRVEGFIITGQQTARASIEQLAQGYFFDAVESDYILKFVPRGGSSVASIAEDKLIPGANSEMLGIVRAQEIELPQRVNIVYIDRASNYQPGAQLSQRLVTQSRETAVVNLPIVMAGQTAKIIADVTVFNRWMARTSYQFDVGWEFAALEPGDIVEVTAGSATHTVRITATKLQSPGMLRVQGVAEDVSTYDFYTPPADTPALTEETAPLAPTQLQILDLPAFPLDDPNKPVLRFAAAGLASGWRGSIVYRSDDGGSNYNRLVDLNSACAMGVATNALADFTGGNVFDETGSVTVLLLGEAELASMSQLAVLNGTNLALVGSELLQFTTATLIEPGKYTLSGLLRGRLGTEYAITGHAAGELFVLLDNRLAKDNAALIGLPRLYKPVTLGQTLGQVSAQTFTYSGKAFKPYSPVQITGTRDGGGDLTLSWIRRTRTGTDLRDYVDVPLNEVTEAYEVEIMNGGTVVRTLSGLSTPSASYTAAQQTTDFGSPQSSVSVKVYQLSAVIGRGYAGVASV